ncbi:actin-like ATPase domain-containing protein [Cantharellus anzutake]|uniref:actin-like ATPase domain-containing protein n=1 Tax=Cantharellus anzutake TaxID=1750568 RepID=UPI001903E82C|nr:actin-like ATPase domain-containing protein [Cantharellus anzutake]KAF8335867.1 actin-like ATPase domain-containing protein [Cantharellus anzutake]
MPKLLTVLACLSFLLPSTLGAVLAIDYGTDWTTASLMKPGIPFDVLLNRDSKRKIHSSVGWNRADRLFGSDALNIATRFPQDSFPSLKHLVGAHYSSNKTSYYSQLYQATTFESERKTITIRRPHLSEGAEWTVEELLAMQFAYIKDLASELANEVISDAVLAVPPYFSQVERQSFIDALEISGLRLLALVHDGTAVAVNYAMTRSFPEKEFHVIYDAGAGAIRATVASFSSPDAPPPSTTTTKIARNLKTTTKESAIIEIFGFGWNKEATGNELTRRLKYLFINRFEEKHGKDILSADPKALARLLKEAERVKGILSANTDAFSMVESITGDIDFRTKTSRAEFEGMCEDLKPLYVQPILDALANSGLTMENITSVILAGGHSRVPMVQAELKALVGESKIAQNVNADESFVLGSAFYGATLSRQFRTKKLKVQDVSPYDFQVSYETEVKKGGKRSISTVVYPKGSKLGVKKTLTLKGRKEFPTSIYNINISNVTEAISNLTTRGAVDPVVKVTLFLTDSGMLTVHDVIAYGEVKDDSLTGKLKNLFGGGASLPSDSSTSSPTSDDGGSASAPSPSSPAPESSVSVTAKEDKNIVPLVWETEHVSIRPLTPSEKQKSKRRLLAVDQAELATRQLEEARNVLEGHIYRLKDLLAESAASVTPFAEFSTADERNKLLVLVEETSQWLSEGSNGADAVIYNQKREALQALEDPITGRQKEAEALPGAIADLNKALAASRSFLKLADEGLTAVGERADEDGEEVDSSTVKWTAEEAEEIRTIVEETQSWFQKQLDAVVDQPKNVDAPIRAIDLDIRGSKLQKKVLRLINRKAAKPKPSSRKSTTSSSTQTRTEGSTGEKPEPTHIPREDL